MTVSVGKVTLARPAGGLDERNVKERELKLSSRFLASAAGWTIVSNLQLESLVEKPVLT